MVNRPGRRQLPFSLSNRRQAQITNKKHLIGTVRNAKYAGPKQPGPAWLAYYLNDGIFWITYYLETDNGEITKLPLTELEEINVC